MIRAWAIVRGGEAQVASVDRQTLADELGTWGADAEIVELTPVRSPWPPGRAMEIAGMLSGFDELSHEEQDAVLDRALRKAREP